MSDEEELKFRCIRCGRISTVGQCCGRDTREVTPAGTKPTTDEDEDFVREIQIFMGNGFVSGAECFKLVDSLHKALEILGGIQQSHDRKEVEEGQEEVNKIAKNIYEKLTGKPLRRGHGQSAVVP